MSRAAEANINLGEARTSHESVFPIPARRNLRNYLRSLLTLAAREHEARGLHTRDGDPRTLTPREVAESMVAV